MFDTNIVVVGNVLTAPEWRRTTNTNSLVANFKVASTARRLDRETGRWVDGNSLRVRVNCWRKLAEGVASSVMVGDPVVVVGRLYTRDWIDGDGKSRTMYEMEAVAVGHDLARGRGKFMRNRPALATSAVETPDSDAHVRGEAAEPVPEDEVPARFGDGLFDDEEPGFLEVPPTAPAGYDPLATLRGGGFEPDDTSLSRPDNEMSPYGSSPAGEAGAEPVADRAGVEPDEAGGPDGDESGGDTDGEPAVDTGSTTGGASTDSDPATGRPRPRRPARRTPVPA